MSIWFADTEFTSRQGATLCGFARGTVFSVATFGLAMLLTTATNNIRADEPAAATADEVPQEAGEDSLIVATRDDATSDAPAPDDQAPPEPAAPEVASHEADTLEPISESSEPTPELAEGTSEPQPVADEDTANDEDSATEKQATESPKFEDALAKVAKPAGDSSTPAPQKAPQQAPDKAKPAISREPVQFQGIIAGTSTKSDLVTAWGKPVDTIDTEEGDVLTFDIKPFASVDVLIGPRNIVSAIKVGLAESIDPEKLAEQLSLSEFESVTVRDESGQSMGRAFPERGVLFMFSESGSESLKFDEAHPQLVSHVAVQPLEARSFALRAECRPRGQFEKCIDDLTTAIAIEPDYAHAHWLLAGHYLEVGQADSAVMEATAACELEPNVAMYQLRRGQALELLGEYDEAVHTIRAVLDRHDIEPVERALALHGMARLASLGDVQIASKAIAFDNRAIEIVDRVATSKDESTRRASKQLLVEAHLAVAEEIARQAFNQKVESLSLWIGRASGIAEESIEHDGGSHELRLLIAQRALAALASFKPTLDPAPWVTEAEEAARTLAAQSDDALWQQHVKWQLGIMYLHALRVEHLRREATNALRYGQLAVDNLAEGATSRQAVHSSEQLVAQLYFHMGAVHAVLRQDHAKAMSWYEKAIPLLTGPRPVSELYSPRREGEMLVSIGVTCWQVSQQTKALEVTRSGTNLVEMAVEDGILAKTALAVPYGNLATMYNQMGESTNSAKYLELARSVKGPKPAGETQVAGASAANQSNRALQTTAQQPEQTRLR